MRKKNAVISGTHLGVDGIIICSTKRITFIHKSPQREMLKRWYYKDIRNVYIETKEDIAVIEFYQYERRVVFSNLSVKAVKKIQAFIEKNKMKTTSDCY